MRSFRLLPQGLIARATLVLICAVLIEFVGSFLLHEQEDVNALRAEQSRQVAEVLGAAIRIVEPAPPGRRAAAADSLDSRTFDVSWRPVASIPAAPDPPLIAGMKASMKAWEPRLRVSRLRLEITRSGKMVATPRVVAAVALQDGSWVEVAADMRRSVRNLFVQQLISAAILCGGILAIAGLLLRGMGGPLRALEHAAQTVGSGRVIQVPEEGAGDLRRVARAFNAMQRRITDLLATRTQALAAVGHDLRTPLSRLRLRAGLVSDAETRAALEQDVDEMTAMLDSLLAYLGGQHEREPARLTDVAAMALTLVDAATDAGRPAAYRGPDQLMATVRPMALKRAADNLLQNAVAYGERAELSLFIEDGVLVLRVDDDGPGIPADQMGQVTEAFYRLDHARARNTNGLGLGLSIVKRIAESEGGALRLLNRAEGGLRAELRLPQAR